MKHHSVPPEFLEIKGQDIFHAKHSCASFQHFLAKRTRHIIFAPETSERKGKSEFDVKEILSKQGLNLYFTMKKPRLAKEEVETYQKWVSKSQHFVYRGVSNFKRLATETMRFHQNLSLKIPARQVESFGAPLPLLKGGLQAFRGVTNATWRSHDFSISVLDLTSHWVDANLKFCLLSLQLLSYGQLPTSKENFLHVNEKAGTFLADTFGYAKPFHPPLVQVLLESTICGGECYNLPKWMDGVV